ncbi:MAG: anti-sigma regulatory factor [bacterium]
MEIKKDCLKIIIDDESEIGEARRLATALTRALNFSETKVSNIAIIVTELGTNLIKHCNCGEIILRVIEYKDASGVEILSIDRGPGIKDIVTAMKDGYSTKGTLGGGLGAIKRLSHTFDFYTKEGFGSLFLSRIWNDKFNVGSEKNLLDFGIISFPKAGEDANGDNYSIRHYADKTVIFLIDGLGHGLNASESAIEAVKVFDNYYTEQPQRLMERISKAIYHTRGGAGVITLINKTEKTINFVGIGNISAFIIENGVRKTMVSQNGIIGEDVARIREYTYTFSDDAIIILHSDGITAKWDLSDYPGIEYRHPAIIAGILYRDFSRGNDDLTAIVVKRGRK